MNDNTTATVIPGITILTLIGENAKQHRRILEELKILRSRLKPILADQTNPVHVGELAVESGSSEALLQLVASFNALSAILADIRDITSLLDLP